MREFFARIAPCRIGMEACGSAHYWARELVAMGHEVVLMPPAYIKPYVKRGKNDALDAAAICEAMSRPDMRFVPIKSADQQAVLMLHKTRELLVKQRTMSVNALRGHLSEFGLVVAKGISRVDELLELADSDASAAGRAPERRRSFWPRISKGSIDRSTPRRKRSPRANARSPTSRLLDRIPGVGPLIASAIAASVPDPGAFKSGRDFAAWLGLTPRQNSSGGKEKLGAITKQGNRYIRKMLVVGCDVGAARRRQTQRRACRLDRRVAGEKAGAPGRGGARQQAGADLLGDHDDRRGLPPGDISPEHRANRRIGSRRSLLRVWRAQRDVMNDMVATEGQGHPAKPSRANKLAAMIGTEAVGLHQGQRP